jgi:hypothetical protein
MKKLFLLLALNFTLVLVYSQESIVKEEWAANPGLHKIEEKYLNESAVVILDKRRMEYIDEQDDLVSYKTFHKIIRVNDDKGIESFNRVYLGVADNSDIIDIRARTILPNGKVIELDRSNIKDLKDEDGSMYKIFALEGLVKGCEVEYYYTYKRPVTFFMREIIQSSTPVLESIVEIIGPKRLIFETKLYNAPGIEPLVDTSSEKKRVVRIVQKNMAGLEEEKYSNYTANLNRIEYKLSYNTSRSKMERVFTWNELAKRLYELYSTYTEKENKKVEDLIDSRGWRKLKSDREKIVAVEHYLKMNFAAREEVDIEDAENLEKILKTKITNFRGIVRLYGCIYQKLGIPFQYVQAGDRKTFVVDRSFENWNNPENPLLYFTNEKKFLAPTRPEMRYPWINPTWGSTNALFCKTTTIGNFTTALAEIKQVPLENYKESMINTEADIRLNGSLDTLNVNIKQLYAGYAASIYRAAFNFSSEEEQKLYLKEFVKFGTNSENIVSSKIENKEFEAYNDNKPFIIQANVNASELVEKAGNKILVKIGDIIGPQVEMYQEKPRQSQIDIEFPHVLERTIRFTIPEGYTIKNADELNINHTHADGGQLTMGFVSGYKMNGNTLTVNVMEEYRNTTYPISQYEDYKRIINAAADFNKIVLVLEKQ